MGQLNCLEYFDSLRGVTNFETSQKVFSDYLFSMGISDFGYGEAVRTKNTLTYQLDHLPSRFSENYSLLGNGVHDPVIRQCMKTAMPVFWDDAPGISQLTDDEKVFISKYLQLGYAHGITIPFKRNDNYFHLLTLPLASQEDCVDFVRENLSDICTLACFYQNSIAGLNKPLEVTNLTSRQRDCLVYSGEGYSSKQIAHYLKIKEDTVNKHIEEAIRRLGARNRVHAVAILLQNGIIQ